MKESPRIRLIAMTFALVAGLAILALKFYAARVADSSALRSDAMESIVNVLAAVFGLGSVIFAEKPADRDHPYGHGKIEYFAQAFEGGLITLAGSLIIIDTIERLYSPQPLQDLGLGLRLNILAGVGNGVVGLILVAIGRKYESTIIRSDGLHLLTDLATTVGMALGLGLVLWQGWTWMDPLLAFLTAIFLFRTGFQLVRESSKALLDAENPELIARIVGYLQQLQKDPAFDQILAVHDLKAQEFGRDKHIDIHVVVPETLSVKEAHDLGDRYAGAIMKFLGHDSMVHTHIDPCDDDYRAEFGDPTKKRPPITVESATVHGKH